MKLVIHRPEEKIRLVVISFSLFVALMLFQTSYMRLGTLTASATLLMTIGTYFLQGKGLRGRLSLNRASACLLMFLVYSVMLTLLKGMRPSGFVRYIAQIIMCLLLFSVELNQREHDYLKKVFSAAATVYAVLIIQSYSANSREGYSHEHVLIFNTAFDPNFIGIPLVAATVLLLDNILKKRNWQISAAMYAIITVTIVYTASRGSFVALLCSNVLLFAFFMLKRNMSTLRKLLYLLLPLFLLLILLQIFRHLFPIEWERITSFNISDGQSRFRLWKVALQDWWDSPVLGKGLGYAYAAHAYETHNTYLQMLSETGVLGICLMIPFVCYMLRKSYKEDNTLFCMLLGAMAQISFLSALDNRCLWILFCWIAMIPNRIKAQRDQNI